MKQIPHIIGGETVATGYDKGPVFNPATGQQTGEVMFADAGILNDAVAAAVEAQKEWAVTPAAKRANVMFAFRQIMKERKDEIAETISAEHGKNHDDALGEVARALEVVEFASSAPHLLKGDFSRNVANRVDTMADREPLGVVAGITPFNFPAMVPLWMIPMALACGNGFVLKPSEKDPSCANLIHDLLAEAGLPAGVFNVVHGDKTAVDAILDHPDIAAVSFVGSTPIAEYVYQRGCASAKRVQALGGAKNHMVVMPDADLEQATDALLGAGYGSAGERCMAISVAMPVGEETADRLVEMIAPRVRELKIGPSNDPKTEMGPLITEAHRDRVAGLIGQGQHEGADVVVDGRGLALQGYEDGYWLGGSLIDRVKPGMSVYDEEIFGPVLSVCRADSYDDAIEQINANPYANGTAIFTRDGDTAREFAYRIKVGMVGVNVPIPVPVGYHSFGGWKRSIFGAHGIYGPEGVHFYTRLKTITARWPTGLRKGADFKFPTMN
ncbi:MAG: methylmalonate-semialdehyde dehydrogenase (CoA acylating) [Chloroflexi bacterium]|nr:methylmalonate-semialdehyde dehydrogenase (CoA acylating) [Chloroflexota bacterium]